MFDDQPIRALPLREHVYERLQGLLISRSLAPGDHLVEERLAGHLGVSRGPVREALQRLHRDGWVTLRPRYGAFVNEPTAQQVTEFFEARELVADAALGLVDAVELVSCFDDRGALVLYHHLLSCGLRLAATAGTDTFLSFARGPAPASNPPGWGRMYAQLGAAPLSTAARTGPSAPRAHSRIGRTTHGSTAPGRVSALMTPTVPSSRALNV